MLLTKSTVTGVGRTLCLGKEIANNWEQYYYLSQNLQSSFLSTEIQKFHWETSNSNTYFNSYCLSF